VAVTVAVTVAVAVDACVLCVLAPGHACTFSHPLASAGHNPTPEISPKTHTQSPRACETHTDWDTHKTH